jgi:hypothetical protein
MLAPTALKHLPPDLNELCSIGPVNDGIQIRRLRERLKWASFLQPCSRIPFHKTNPLDDWNYFEGFAIVPSSGIADPKALTDSLDLSMRRINWLKSLAPDPVLSKNSILLTVLVRWSVSL